LIREPLESKNSANGVVLQTKPNAGQRQHGKQQGKIRDALANNIIISGRHQLGPNPLRELDECALMNTDCGHEGSRCVEDKLDNTIVDRWVENKSLVGQKSVSNVLRSLGEVECFGNRSE
jgi:hypothetical protein